MKLLRSPAPNPILLYLVPSLSLGMILVSFLLLSSNFLLQPGIAVDVPQSPFLLSPQRNPRIVSITGPPMSAIFYEDEELDLAALRDQLKSVRGRSQTLIIKADRMARFDHISAVMTIALDLGFPVVLATSEEGP